MSLNQNAHRIMNAMKRTIPSGSSSSLIYGTVVSVSPLSINVEGRLTIPAEFLTSSLLARSTPLWRGLQQGDSVAMSSDGRGENYHILERLGMEIDINRLKEALGL